MPNNARFSVFRAMPWPTAADLQKQTLAKIAADPQAPAEVLFCEHTPVITCGRSGDGSNLLASAEELKKNGIDFFPAGRGGDVTWHGPGQWTVYPILRLEWYGRDLHKYLRLMEECAINFLARYGVQGGRRAGLTGAWVGGAKVAAVGVAVSRWITWHGFALNIAPNLENFTRWMHPCGIRAEQGAVASLQSLTGREYTMEATLPVLQEAVAEVLQLKWV